MATKNPARYQTRIEPATGTDYAKCTECGRESIHGESDILHEDDCPERDYK